MYTMVLSVLLGLLLSLSTVATAAKMKTIETVRLTTAEVEAVELRDDSIVGKVVNKSPHPIRDVELLIRHIWLWDDEYDPNRDVYSTSTYLPVAGQIGPGESKEFVYVPSLPEIPGGHFETKIIVGEFQPLRRSSE